jgi:GNAT superfamily N-acetyltransferase
MTIPLDDYQVQDEHKLTPDLHAFILQAYNKLFGSFIDNFQDGPADLRNFNTTYMIPGGRFITLRERGVIIGMIGYRPFDRRFEMDGVVRKDLAFPSQMTVEILRLFVAETHRSKGLASRLIKELVARAKEDKVDVMYLHTHAFLTGARNLWEKNGWEVIVIDNDEPWNTIHMVRVVSSDVEEPKIQKWRIGDGSMTKNSS